MKIFLIGFMGSGKTHWGRIWAQTNALDFYDLDEMIEKKENRSITEIFEELGENYFREKESTILRTFSEKDNFLLSCGGGAPCFYDNMQWMNDTGITIFLSLSAQDVFNRISEEKDKRPLLKNLNPAEVLFYIEQKFKEREPFYGQAKFILPVNKLDENSLTKLKTVLKPARKPAQKMLSEKDVHSAVPKIKPTYKLKSIPKTETKPKIKPKTKP